VSIRDDLSFVLPTGGVQRAADPREERLRTIQDSAGLADYLRGEREVLLTRLRAPCLAETGNISLYGVAMAREFSDLMDAIIARICALACARTGANTATLPIAIVATGGYGRRELSPFSDVDITFIPQRDGDSLTDRVIREMFSLVMDVCIARCGLEVGYAYRLLEDCRSLDHQTTCGLLDARLIIGSSRLFIQFEDAFWMGFNPTDFIFTKIAEREQTLGRWGWTPRVVEPQLKEGPGGLRDLQTAVWLVQARHHLVAARVRGERAFDILTREGKLTAHDVSRLTAAKERLFCTRNVLHALTGSERDELVITRQEEVAFALGYQESSLPPMNVASADSPIATQPPPVERFMAELYPSMALVRRVADQIMRRIGNSRLMLGIGLDCKRKQVVPANEALESDDPVWLLWMSELAQKYQLELGEGIERAAAGLVEMNPVLAEPLQAAQVFTQILQTVGRVYPILQKMADLGILGWFLPEVGKIMDLIPYDPSHDHTVGQHSLLVIKHLEAVGKMDGSEEQSEMRRVLEEIAHPEQLILAALLHDSGKAIPGRPHSEVSEEIASVVCDRLGWSDEATNNVRFLVRNHLLMAEISRLRDLHLDETIRDFTREVDDLDRLNMLYLLTYADTSAVGAGVWTQVKGRFLRDLWRRAAAVLTDEETVDHDEATIARARRRLLKDLSLENLPEAEVQEHIQAMPPHYLLNHSMQQIALHIRFIQRVREGHPVVDFHDERDATYTELTICAIDDPQPGLLAKIAGVLFAASLEVHSAKVITRVTPIDRIALDTLWVDYRGRQLSAGKRREVATNLSAILTGTQSVHEILEKRRLKASGPKDKPMCGTPLLNSVSIRNDLSETLTVVETGGPDVNGAFYYVCDALSRLGWDICSARVSTWRGEARASFYIDGARHLSESEARRALASVLTITCAERRK
jgi:[protein-PII] uridylyltransferase